MTNINAEEIELGEGVVISPTATITGVSGKAKRVKIGDHTYIGDSVQIFCDDLAIGDYSKIHHHTNIHGYKPCHIGHNAWVGQYTIIDCIGGVSIGNNCGIGAHSQLWSHIKYGDTLEGCRFLSEKSLKVGNDVWFVGHCIISPIVAEDKSMAMVGSVVTKDMVFNEIYAGSPAKSISEKVGFQFHDVSVDRKFEIMQAQAKEFGTSEKIKVVKGISEIDFDSDCTFFDVSNRKYTKRKTDEEVRFMKFLLPEKGKFTPY